MGVICTLGDITFEVSADTVRTISEWVHTARGRWAIHNVLGQKPRAEFIGPGQNEITMNIKLLSEFGVDPRAVYGEVGTFILEGRHAPLILGERPIGNGEWYIEENESEFKYIDGTGQVDCIIMNATLREYF